MFNVFKKILQNKDLTQEDLDKISPFIMCRWLQGNPGTLQIAQFFNMYPKIPLDVQVKVLQEVTKGKLKFIPYIKGSKIDSSDIELISKYFKISFEKAQMYSEFITPEDFKQIKQELKSLEPSFTK